MKRKESAPSVPPERILPQLSVRVPDAVQMTGIPRIKLYGLIKTGQISIVKVGRTTLIRTDDLRRFLETNRR